MQANNVIKNFKDSNVKPHKAWDAVGPLFWSIGHNSLRTDFSLVELMLNNICPDDEVCIIGATILPLIKESIRRNLKLTVIDFSEHLCKSLADILGDKNLTIINSDILSYMTHTKNKKKFSYILTDQLFNCFSPQKVISFFSNLQAITKPGAIFRCFIKHGLYEIDKKLLEAERQVCLGSSFYNKINNTVNYQDAKKLLSRVIHHQNPQTLNQLIRWYSSRAEEQRFDSITLIKLITQSTQPCVNDTLSQREVDTKSHLFFYELPIP